MGASSYLHILAPEQYVAAREDYGYDDDGYSFVIGSTPGLSCGGSYKGVFARKVPRTHLDGMNLRRFEEIVQEVFQNAQIAKLNGNFVGSHSKNLRNITEAVVHWKNASQHGRASSRVKILTSGWKDPQTAYELLDAYSNWSLSKFRIAGVAIPTASAFLRFLDPVEYGVIDKVVVKWTQCSGITHLTLRKDGYINNTGTNVQKYEDEYVSFLRAEAEWLNSLRTTFKEVSSAGKSFRSCFRACDVEMALWQLGSH